MRGRKQNGSSPPQKQCSRAWGIQGAEEDGKSLTSPQGPCVAVGRADRVAPRCDVLGQDGGRLCCTGSQLSPPPQRGCHRSCTLPGREEGRNEGERTDINVGQRERKDMKMWIKEKEGSKRKENDGERNIRK